MKRFDLRGFFLGVAVSLVILGSALGGAVADRLYGIGILDYFAPVEDGRTRVVEQKVVREESVVIEIADQVSPSVVTISLKTPRRTILEFSPFGGFGLRERGGEDQDIATGFIVSPDGLVVTNKHVVSQTGVTYKVVTKDGTEYEVKNIYRDPANDLALLKIDPSASSGQALKAVELGDSDSLRVGQFVIAIGTALGEFRHTVTTGVISGLGRGITAGSPFEGFVERLDNVIQTDAAINLGNSGGPLLNSSGQVIGVNVAVAAGAENVGFAIPINVVKDSIKQFRETGEFTRPFLGVRYQMISQEAALLNEVPQGAYVLEVITGSSADNAGVEPGDIITRLGNEQVREETGGLGVLVNKHKVGEKVPLEVWRDGETLTLSTTLTEAPQ